MRIVVAEPDRPQHGGGDRARDAGHRSRRRRGHGRPAGRPPDRPGARGVLPRRPADGGRTASRPAPSASSRPLVTLGRPARPTPATEYGYLVPRADDRCQQVAGLPRPTRSRALRGEAGRRPRAEDLLETAGRRLERGHVPVAAAGDPGGARALHHARRRVLGAGAASPTTALAAAYEPDPARSRSTTRSWSRRRADGQVVMASLDVGWSDLGGVAGAARGARAARAEGGVVQAGRGRRTRTATTCWSSRTGGRLGRPAGARRVRWSPSGRSPSCAGRRADATDVVAGPARPVCCSGGSPVTNMAEAPAPTTHRLRDRRLARPGRGRVHVRERPPLRGRRRPLRRRARRAGQGRRHRVRPAVRVGALRRGRRRGPPRARHPGRDQPPPPCRPR